MSIKRIFLDYAQNHRFGAARLAGIAAHWLRAYRNHDYRITRNGELWVIDRVCRLEPRRIFDVGAHRGDWTAIAHERSPQATVIDAFEIAPRTTERLSERFSQYEGIHVHDFGLGDQNDTVVIEYDLAGDHTGTTMRIGEQTYPERLRERQESKTLRGDAFCEAEGITSIDFLKIDVEGAEPNVLSGFEAMLTAGQIGLIQFEYNSLNIGTRYLLADHYRFLEGYGFSIGKLWARGASFGPYRVSDEDFKGPNFLAVHESRPELREALAYYPKQPW